MPCVGEGRGGEGKPWSGWYADGRGCWCDNVSFEEVRSHAACHARWAAQNTTLVCSDLTPTQSQSRSLDKGSFRARPFFRRLIWCLRATVSSLMFTLSCGRFTPSPSAGRRAGRGAPDPGAARKVAPAASEQGAGPGVAVATAALSRWAAARLCGGVGRRAGACGQRPWCTHPRAVSWTMRWACTRMRRAGRRGGQTW